MKVVLERIEYTWWSFHIRFIDEVIWIRKVLPRLKGYWERREEAIPYLVLSILGFPVGVLVGYISTYFR